MTTTSEVSPPMNHVFVDFENVHHVDAAVIGAKAVSFTILVGARQTKLDAALVEMLMEHAAAVKLVRLTSSDKNAVDFALTYYLGRAVLADPTAFFHIISKDTGYDPLIEHLQSRHVKVRRHDDYTTLTFARPPKAAPVAPKATPARPEEQSKIMLRDLATHAAAKAAPAGPEEQLSRVLEHLRKITTTRPKKKKTLLSHLKSNLGKDATEADATKLLDKLIKAGHIKIDDKEVVTYHV